MADQQTKSLILKFTADTLPAQRQIQALAQASVGSFLAVGASANRSSSALGDLASKAQSLRGVADHIPIVGGLIGRSLGLIAGLAQEAQKEIAELVRIADASRAAGVGTTFFQAYIAQAQALGVETSTLVNELNRARDAGKVSIGKLGDDDAGKSDALKTLGKTVDAGNLGTGDLAAFKNADAGEARIRVMLDLLDKLDAKGAKLAEYDLANKFFGESFEVRLRAGTDAIGDMRDSLDKINQSGGAMIVPPEQIAHAKMMQAEIAELNERLTAITAPAVQKIDGLFQNVDEVLIAGEAAVVHYTEALGEFIAKWLGAGNSIAWANSKVLELANALRNLAGIKPLTIDGNGQVNTDDPTGEKMARARKNLALQMGAAPPEPSRRPDDLDLTPYGTLPMTVHGSAKRPASGGDTSHPYLADRKSTGSGSAKEDPVESYIDELKKSAAAEEAMARTLGLTDKARQEALDLAKAQAIAQKDGRSLTEAETASIRQQADAYAAAKVKIDQFAKAQEDAKARAEFLGQAFESSIEKMALEGGKLKDVLLDVIKQLEQAALKALILGEGPLAGLLGMGSGGMNGEGKGYGGLGGLLGFATSGFGGGASATGPAAGLGALTGLGKMFAGFFADGGTIPAGMLGIVGERGAEIVNGPATVTPHAAIGKMMSSMGGGGTVATLTHAPTIIVPPSFTQDQAQAMIDKSQQSFARNIVPILSNAQRRYGS